MFDPVNALGILGSASVVWVLKNLEFFRVRGCKGIPGSKVQKALVSYLQLVHDQINPQMQEMRAERQRKAPPPRSQRKKSGFLCCIFAAKDKRVSECGMKHEQTGLAEL